MGGVVRFGGFVRDFFFFEGWEVGFFYERGRMKGFWFGVNSMIDFFMIFVY